MAYTEERAYVELHLAVFLWGFTAILGDLIQLSALTLVWWRVLLTTLSLVFFVRIHRVIREVGWRRFGLLAGIGVVVALHWVTFYGAIKLANASIALICMATTSLFSSLLEPLIVGRPFRWFELLLGIFILPGIWLVVDGVDSGMNIGIGVGLLSAALVSIFTSLNKKYIGSSNPQRITFIELGAATLFLTPFLIPFGGNHFWPAPLDWAYLLVLSLLCTTLTFFLSLRSLSKLSAFASNLTVNLEPVYGIFLAYFLLDDAQELSPNFYWGALLIVTSVFGYTAIMRQLRRRALLT
ncbi:drug/metabolite transporter (DMT)-like permease [Lewinella marina]|uniref:EamA family transporter n=1 Tax=Neolewinella marina TaxID=438751 RepID=A0A2G0CCH6_9BACT|nr:EamA family transporter [Neolewinella marina]NJB87651.1 drug/metabolite transporter (DMT)-like permease [Neolewinella marina]PHK97665.1 EamA family transporter [Neolewinella marina]